MNNVRDINNFKKYFTNYWYGEWLLINEKMILIMGLMKTNKRLVISIFCKNVVK